MPRVARLPVFYNCDNCPAYCCSYEHIEVTPADLARLAARFGLSEAEARRRFTKARPGDPATRIMRHQKDYHFGSACRFLDTETRHCTIYDARPEICRSYPGAPRCGFYDFLMAERSCQEDPQFVPNFTRR
jgi:Fe-S-cluster containining protein